MAILAWHVLPSEFLTTSLKYNWYARVPVYNSVFYPSCSVVQSSPKSDIRTFHHHPRMKPCARTRSLFHSPDFSSLQPLISSLCRFAYSLDRNEIMQYVVFSVWLLSLSIMLLRCIHVVARISILFFVTTQWHSIVQTHHIPVFIRSSADRPLCCSHFWLLWMTTWTFVCKSICIGISFGIGVLLSNMLIWMNSQNIFWRGPTSSRWKFQVFSYPCQFFSYTHQHLPFVFFIITVVLIGIFSDQSCFASF